MTLVAYTTIPIQENNEPLVELSKFGILADPKYFQQGLSGDSRILLREGIGQKLQNIQRNLGKLQLKVWDIYRSRDVQNNIYQKYWNELSQENPDWNEEKLKLEVGKFISPPYQTDRIPPHATGGAVDLTLADENGNDLEMGTEFDYFGNEASTFFYEIYQIKPQVAENRRILCEAMLSEGFTLDQDEWWHFDYGSQIWALKKGKEFAIYGEVKN